MELDVFDPNKIKCLILSYCYRFIRLPLTSIRFPSTVFCSWLFSFNKRLFSFITFVFLLLQYWFLFFGDFSIMSFLEKLKFIFIGQHS